MANDHMNIYNLGRLWDKTEIQSVLKMSHTK